MFCISAKWLVLATLLLNAAYVASSTRQKLIGKLRSDCNVTRGWIEKTVGECTFVVRTNGCLGSCISTAKWHLTRKEIVSSCSCCAPIFTRKRVIKRVCNGKDVRFSFEVAKRCACRPCMFG